MGAVSKRPFDEGVTSKRLTDANVIQRNLHSGEQPWY